MKNRLLICDEHRITDAGFEYWCISPAHGKKPNDHFFVNRKRRDEFWDLISSLHPESEDKSVVVAIKKAMDAHAKTPTIES